jgi:hypothetical protein
VSRGLHIAAALLLLCGCAALPGARVEPGPEERIESMVREWFDLLAEEGPASRPLEALLAGPPYRLSLAEAEVRSRDELRAWRDRVRARHSRIEHGFEPIRVQPIGGGLYRVHFELDRRAVDAAGTPHVARSEQTWLVRDTPGGALMIQTIDERRLLPFPGTGPRIVCY